MSRPIIYESLRAMCDLQSLLDMLSGYGVDAILLGRSGGWRWHDGVYLISTSWGGKKACPESVVQYYIQ